MIRFASVIFAIAVSGVAMAQTAAPQTQYTPEQRRQYGIDRRACAEEVNPRNLARGERGKAMRNCMEGRNPAYKAAFDRSGQRREEMKKIRQDCRADLANKRLTEDERRSGMQSCIVAKRPEMAKQFACADQARQKGLGPGTERRNFMRDCRRG